MHYPLTAHYLAWSISVQDAQQCDILIALLSELGFDGFEENSGNLTAYGIPENIQVTEAQALLAKAGLKYETIEIASQNWNALWEESFEPVTIDDFCRIRAHFHASEAGYEHEICITPKMSFGTGHHATTRMMIRMMKELNFSGKNVLDFGAGTGVLAILAEKLGATTILAIENDPGAVENARENAQLNSCRLVETQESSLEKAGQRMFDVILANINRNILVQYAPELTQRVLSEGYLVLSGILLEDVPLLRSTFETQDLCFDKAIYEGNWACLRFIKNNNNLHSMPSYP